MNFETVLLEKEEHIGKIILNRPNVLNAINMRMFDELRMALQDVNDDDSIRVVILTGAGRAFCTSVDMTESKAEIGNRLLPHLTIDEIRRMLRRRPQGVIRGIWNMEKPIIAMVNGAAIGDAIDFILACDIRIGSEKSRFMSGFSITGLYPNTGSTWFYPRFMPINKALELMYTSDWMSAEEASRWGILNRLVSSDKLEDETMALAKKLAQGPPSAIRLMKLHMRKGLSMRLEEVLELAADGEALMLSTKDHIEGVSALLEKRQPKFMGK